MLWTEQLFGVKKPIFSMLHLDPLPGDPAFKHGDTMKRVVDLARNDLKALQNGGVDGIIFSNEFSLPYQRNMQFITPAAMARVIGELMKDITVPYGVDCISDGLASIELAAAVDAKFIRGTFSGVYVGDGGLYDNDLPFLMRRKAALHLDELRMLYFINPESDKNLDLRPLADIAKSVIFKASPDGLCISASAAGQEVDNDLIKSVKAETPNVVVICNTGCRNENIKSKLEYADAAIVGTTFKEDGDFYKHVDESRVKAFMKIVSEYRASL
ncbi:MAG: BtpA/SgcQ family protein [Clostridia bacterium]|nr:BtpA/SgcQ family protein [Clostridia bacterium]